MPRQKKQEEENLSYDRMLVQEELILEFTERICEFMDSHSISRSELARRLGKTKGFVSQLLGGGRNLTLRTIADVLYALHADFRFELNPSGYQATSENVLWFEDPAIWKACGDLCQRKDAALGTETCRVFDVELTENIEVNW